MRTKFLTLRLMPLTLAVVFVFSTVIANVANVQSAHAVAVPNNPQCQNISSFGTTVITNAQADIGTMRASLDNTYNNLAAQYKAEDASALGSQSALIGGFVAQINAQIAAASAGQKPILEKYKTTAQAALNTFLTNTNAARSQYEEDMLALLKQHQAALTVLANGYVTTQTNNMNAALSSCGALGSDLSFLFTVLGSGFNYIAQVLNQDVVYIGKALQIITTYVSAIVNELATLVVGVLSAMVGALNSMIHLAFG